MSISEDRLIGWLCFVRLSFTNGRVADVPTEVQSELVRRGWIEVDDEEDFDGLSTWVTDAGACISDLNGPEWGIDPLPQPADA
jgi:hypothetical protein